MKTKRQYFKPDGLEDKILQETYIHGKRGTLLECQSALLRVGIKRSIGSIRGRTYRLVYSKPLFKSGLWNNTQHEKLVRYAGRVRLERLPQILGRPKRTVGAIEKYAAANGISLSRRDNYYTEQDVADIFGVSYTWVDTRITRGALQSINHRQYKQNHMISAKHIKDFLKLYPAELQDIINKGARPDMVLLIDIMTNNLK